MKSVFIHTHILYVPFDKRIYDGASYDRKVSTFFHPDLQLSRLRRSLTCYTKGRKATSWSSSLRLCLGIENETLEKRKKPSSVLDTGEGIVFMGRNILRLGGTVDLLKMRPTFNPIIIWIKVPKCTKQRPLTYLLLHSNQQTILPSGLGKASATKKLKNSTTTTFSVLYVCAAHTEISFCVFQSHCKNTFIAVLYSSELLTTLCYQTSSSGYKWPASDQLGKHSLYYFPKEIPVIWYA